MSKNFVETLVGAFILVVAVGFGLFAYQSSNLQTVEGYSLQARFSSVDGITAGSEVRIGGIKIGDVSELSLDDETFEAILTLQLPEDLEIPEDSTASIVSAGLLGGKYVDIQPGGMEDMLVDGDEIAFTQSSVNFETLLGKMVTSAGGVDGDEGDSDSADM